MHIEFYFDKSKFFFVHLIKYKILKFFSIIKSKYYIFNIKSNFSLLLIKKFIESFEKTVLFLSFLIK